jgi:hypothetical protein
VFVVPEARTYAQLVALVEELSERNAEQARVIAAQGERIAELVLNGTPNADVSVAPDDDDLRAASVFATGPSASSTRRPSQPTSCWSPGCRGQADPHRRRPRAPRSGSGAAAPLAVHVAGRPLASPTGSVTIRPPT